MLSVKMWSDVARAYVETVGEIIGLVTFMHREHLVDIATGMVMASRGLTRDEALAWLTREADALGCRPADVAASMIRRHSRR